MKISLDSNTFGVIDFVDWLVLHKDKLEINLSLITALEVYHWYNLRGLSKKQFKMDLHSIDASITEIEFDTIFEISNRAKSGKLRFKHHARDYIIGTEAEINGSTLLTYNLKHFEWINEVEVMTPDEFVSRFDSSLSD